MDDPQKSDNGCLVSIGLPVYNGENFLEETLNSILGQTFSDFELIICDNASTDRTEEICRQYAAQDSRIRYYRNPENLGAAPNYNLVFERSQGKYFKWAPHDDIIAPQFIERCVEVLEREPDVSLCYTSMAYTDAGGKTTKLFSDVLNLTADSPSERFKTYLDLWLSRGFTPGLPVFGLIRSSILAQTPLIGSYVWSDLALVGELGLLGTFHEVPETLLFCRSHDKNSRSTRQKGGDAAFSAWFNPNNGKKLTLIHWRIFIEHLGAIRRAPMTHQERLWCYARMGKWAAWKWKRLFRELTLIFPQMICLLAT